MKIATAQIRLADFRLSTTESLRALVFGTGIFAVLGTFTALWPNPWFVRMTPVTPWEHTLLAGEAVLLGLYLGLRAPACAIKGASVGGVFGFLGFGCALCNKLLLLAFGSAALLTYFEPVRLYLGWLGLAVLVVALWTKLSRRRASLQLPHS